MGVQAPAQAKAINPSSYRVFERIVHELGLWEGATQVDSSTTVACLCRTGIWLVLFINNQGLSLTCGDWGKALPEGFEYLVILYIIGHRICTHSCHNRFTYVGFFPAKDRYPYFLWGCSGTATTEKGETCDAASPRSCWGILQVRTCRPNDPAGWWSGGFLDFNYCSL